MAKDFELGEIKQESLTKPPKVVKDKQSIIDKDKIEKPTSISSSSKNPTKRNADEMTDYSEPGCSKVRYTDEDHAHLIADVSPNNALKLDSDDISSGNKAGIHLPEIKPMGPDQPSNKKFGFLGLGTMGSIMVEKLLLSYHNVTVWNRTAEKCEKFIGLGAKVADTPADVIRQCDITFACLENVAAVKDVMFKEFGVLEGFASVVGSEDKKGYVELTSIDPTTCEEICEAISKQGGRYAEAFMLGSRQSLSQGNIKIIGAGDKILFSECTTCFVAIATEYHFFSTTPGYASKVNLLTSMVYGTSMAALAESLSLVESFGLRPEQFMSILGNSEWNCKLLMNKGREMINKSEKVEQPIKHLQKNLNMAVGLSNHYDQPALVTTMVSEIFKEVSSTNPEGDVSSVYQYYKKDK